MDYFAYKKKASVGQNLPLGNHVYIPETERIIYKPYCVRQFQGPENSLLSPPITSQAKRRFSQPPASTVLPRLHVLLVDDNRINLQILARLLKTHFPGVFEHIESVQSGIRALELLRVRPFDLILMDIDMPLLNGVETTRRIKQAKDLLSQNVGIPIVAVTTNDSACSRTLYTECGMLGCVSKPIILHDLKTILITVLNLDLPVVPPYTPE
ncbi:CheY-like superfamily [Sporodiniella umbellata]|nr:CheY-like superfamily [Sporodiniella umbellata]